MKRKIGIDLGEVVDFIKKEFTEPVKQPVVLTNITLGIVTTNLKMEYVNIYGVSRTIAVKNIKQFTEISAAPNNSFYLEYYWAGNLVSTDFVTRFTIVHDNSEGTQNYDELSCALSIIPQTNN